MRTIIYTLLFILLAFAGCSENPVTNSINNPGGDSLVFAQSGVDSVSYSSGYRNIMESKHFEQNDSLYFTFDLKRTGSFKWVQFVHYDSANNHKIPRPVITDSLQTEYSSYGIGTKMFYEAGKYNLYLELIQASAGAKVWVKNLKMYKKK